MRAPSSRSDAIGGASITGFARLDGWPVAVIASDPYIAAGAWTADSADKLTRFIDLCQTFHLPVVHLVDVPGFAIGVEAEKAATIRHGVRAMSAVYQATVPWCTIMVRKSFGIAGAAVRNHARAQFRYAWPSGDWGSLPVEGGIEAAYKRDLEAAEDPEALLAELRARMETVRSPFRTADAFLVEEIIDPARHPAPAVRVRQPRPAPAEARPERLRDAALDHPAPHRLKAKLPFNVRPAPDMPCAQVCRERKWTSTSRSRCTAGANCSRKSG